MKKLLFVLIFAATGIPFVAAQEEGAPELPVDESSDLITYTDVVEAPGASKDELYDRAVEWVNEFFTNPGSVIQAEDKPDGKLECRHGINIYKEVDGKQYRKGLVRYNLTLDFKDAKYRYKITDFTLIQSPKLPVEKWLEENDPEKEANYGYLRQIDTFANELIDSLREDMKKPAPKADDNW